jgi:signal transduction histidine kinase
MTVVHPGSEPDLWERREAQALRVVPYVLLVISLILVVITRWESGAGLAISVGISVLAAAWITWFVTLHPEWRERQGVMAAYFLGLLVFMAVLDFRSPLFGFFVFTGYLHAYQLRDRWPRMGGVLATAALMAISQTGGVPARITLGAVGVWAAFMLVNSLVAGAFTFFGWHSGEQAERRKTMVSELAEANERLEAMLEENAGLHAQLLTQAREAGVLDERQRMAGEIHDTLAQGLTGIIAQLEAAERARERAADWERHVGSARELARESLSEARRSVQALRPEPLEEARLPDAIGAMAERWSRNAAVPVSVEVTGEPKPLLAEIEVTLFRVAQEALTNVGKHAGAAKAGLTLSYMDDVVLLDVRDDGVGFAVGTNGHDGYGLTGMRRRLRHVAGSLEVESGPGEGTAVNATVPAIPALGGTE